MNTSEQLGVQRDLGVENFGDRAVLLGVAAHPSEAGIGGKIATASAAGASPTRLCLADHVRSPWVSWTELLYQFYQARSRVQFPGASGMGPEDIDALRFSRRVWWTIALRISPADLTPPWPAGTAVRCPKIDPHDPQ